MSFYAAPNVWSTFLFLGGVAP